MTKNELGKLYRRYARADELARLRGRIADVSDENGEQAAHTRAIHLWWRSGRALYAACDECVTGFKSRGCDYLPARDKLLDLYTRAHFAAEWDKPPNVGVEPVTPAQEIR